MVPCLSHLMVLVVGCCLLDLRAKREETDIAWGGSRLLAIRGAFCQLVTQRSNSIGRGRCNALYQFLAHRCEHVDNVLSYRTLVALIVQVPSARDVGVGVRRFPPCDQIIDQTKELER